MKIDLNKKVWQVITLMVLAGIWGSSFILMKKGLETFSNMEVAAYRIFIAFIVLAPVSLIHLRLFTTRYMVPLICSGILGNAVPAFLFTKAQTVISSSFSGMLNSLTPLLTLGVGIAFFGMKTSWQSILGVCIGLLGAMGLLLNGNSTFQNSDFMYGMYVILATACYAFSVNIIKKYLKELDAIVITSLALFSVGPFCGAYLLTTDFIHASNQEDFWVNFGYINILGIVGTSLGVIIFNYLIKKTSPVFASSVTYVIPVVAIAWGVLDNEYIAPINGLWILIIFAGIYVVSWKKNKK